MDSSSPPAGPVNPVDPYRSHYQHPDYLPIVLDSPTLAPGKSTFGYLPTTPGTQVSYTTSKPWCAGHAWRWRNRRLGDLHYLAHRLHLLRVKPARPVTKWAK
jgi:hypothetical protein